MRRALAVGILLGALLPLCATAASSRARSKPSTSSTSWTSSASWSAKTNPKGGAPRAIGSYAGGCLRGGTALAAVGPGFEVLHRGRHRYFGHPALVEFVRRLAVRATERDLPPLLIGDLSQARGGPTPSDHGSHQSGLDVDVSYVRPTAAVDQPLSAEDRESTRFPAVVDVESRTLTDLWNDRIVELLGIAASDSTVDRIFVNAVIKREVCARQPGAPWLRRLRPWWGHHDHFHVRLRCPPGSPTCKAQPPVPEGDGCDELGWWLSDAARRARTERLAKKPSRPAAPRGLPSECREVLR